MGEQHSLADEVVGGPNSDDLTESLALGGGLRTFSTFLAFSVLALEALTILASRGEGRGVWGLSTFGKLGLHDAKLRGRIVYD